MSGDSGGTTYSHSVGLREAHRRKLDDAFAGRSFEIVSEVHLPPGQVFQTLLGNKGRHGYILRDTETGERLVVGASVLKHIHDRYRGVALPTQRRRLIPSTRTRSPSTKDTAG